MSEDGNAPEMGHDETPHESEQVEEVEEAEEPVTPEPEPELEPEPEPELVTPEPEPEPEREPTPEVIPPVGEMLEDEAEPPAPEPEPEPELPPPPPPPPEPEQPKAAPPQAAPAQVASQQTDLQVVEGFNVFIENTYSTKSSRSVARSAVRRYIEYLATLGSQYGDGSVSPICIETMESFLNSSVFNAYAASTRRQMMPVLDKLLRYKEDFGGQMSVPGSVDNVPTPRMDGDKKDKKKENKVAGTQTTPVTPASQPSNQDPMAGIPITPDSQGGAVVQATGTRSVPENPSMKDVKKVLGEQSRVGFYARHDNGDLTPAGQHNTKAIVLAGDLQTFVNEYISPHYPDVSIVEVVTLDARGKETPYCRVRVTPRSGKQGTGTSELREVVSVIDEQRQRARDEEQARWKDERERQEYMFGKMKELGGEGGNSMLKDAMAMDMWKEMRSDMRGRPDEQWQQLAGKVEQLVAKAKEKPSDQQPSIMQQYGEYKILKQIMDEFKAEDRERDRYDEDDRRNYQALPVPPPAAPMVPRRSPAEDFKDMIGALRELQPPQPPPQPVPTFDGFVTTLGSMKGLFGPQTDPNVVALIERMDKRLERLEDSRPPDALDEVDKLSRLLVAVREMGSGNPVSGSATQPDEFWSNAQHGLDKVPGIIDALTRANIAKSRIAVGLDGATGEPLPGVAAAAAAAAVGVPGVHPQQPPPDIPQVPQEPYQDEEAKRRAEMDRIEREKKARGEALKNFATQLEGAQTEDEVVKAIIQVAKKLEREEQFREMFYQLGMFAMNDQNLELQEGVGAFINAVYNDDPPEGAIEAVTRVLIINKESFAVFVGAKEVGGAGGAGGAAPDGAAEQPAGPGAEESQAPPPDQVIETDADVIEA